MLLTSQSRDGRERVLASNGNSFVVKRCGPACLRGGQRHPLTPRSCRPGLFFLHITLRSVIGCDSGAPSLSDTEKGIAWAFGYGVVPRGHAYAVYGRERHSMSVHDNCPPGACSSDREVAFHLRDGNGLIVLRVFTVTTWVHRSEIGDCARG